MNEQEKTEKVGQSKTSFIARDVEAAKYLMLLLPAPLEVLCFRDCFLTFGIFCFRFQLMIELVASEFDSASRLFHRSASASTSLLSMKQLIVFSVKKRQVYFVSYLISRVLSILYYYIVVTFYPGGCSQFENPEAPVFEKNASASSSFSTLSLPSSLSLPTSFIKVLPLPQKINRFHRFHFQLLLPHPCL